MYSAEELYPLFAAKIPSLPPEAIAILCEAVADFAVEVAEREREACAQAVLEIGVMAQANQDLNTRDGQGELARQDAYAVEHLDLAVKKIRERSAV